MLGGRRKHTEEAQKHLELISGDGRNGAKSSQAECSFTPLPTLEARRQTPDPAKAPRGVGSRR